MKSLIRVVENLPILTAMIDEINIVGMYPGYSVYVEHYGRENKNILVVDNTINISAYATSLAWIRVVINENKQIKVRFKYLTDDQKKLLQCSPRRADMIGYIFYQRLSKNPSFWSLLQKTLQQKHRK